MKMFHGGQCLSLERKKTARFDRDHLSPSGVKLNLYPEFGKNSFPPMLFSRS